MSNRAAIDIGSNSVQFLIIDSEKNELFREQYVTGLGRGVAKDSKFDQLSMDETYQALQFCLEQCDNHSVSRDFTIATATEASRKASNAKEFYKKVLSELNLEVSIISGEREAYLSTYGLVQFGSLNDENLLVDIGGASTEVTLFQREPFKILQSISIPLGSVKLSYLQQSEGKQAKDILKEYDLSEFNSESIIGISGTMTSLAAVSMGLKEFNETKVNDVALTRDEIKDLAAKLISMSPEEILEQYPFLGKRAAVISYGSQIMLAMMEQLGANRVVTSTKGLVHGSVLSL